MSKTNRMYKIFMTVMVTIIAGLLLACGVIAVKNSMRVKMSIPANPNFLIEIYIQKDGSETQNLVFKNYGDVQIKNGFSSLSGNKLIANGDDFIEEYGGDFSITIKNFTENMPMLVTVTSTATLANGNDGVPAEITAEKSAAVAYDNANADEVKFNVANKAVFPQTTLLEIMFEQIDGYVVSFNANGGSGTMPVQQHALDGSTALTECTFTAPEGKEFAGWATSANGSVEYTDGQSVSDLKTKAGEEIMLYAVWKDAALPYTIYQYGDTANGAVAAPNDGWTGYSYIVFNNCTTYNGYDLRWIIIGAGTNNHSLVPATVSTARVDSNASGAELGANEVLLLSEKILLNDAFQSAYSSCLWRNSDLKPLLNGTFLTETGLSEYAVEKTLKTTSQYEATGDETTDQIFLLAYLGADSAESYDVRTYLGSYTYENPSSNPRMFAFSGASSSTWHLRSGRCGDCNDAYFVLDDGYIDYSGVDSGRGVRPSFVLNLA